MTVIAFALGSNLYAVYFFNNSIVDTEDILADKVVFSLTFDPFRTEDLIVIDLSRLPTLAFFPHRFWTSPTHTFPRSYCGPLL